MKYVSPARVKWTARWRARMELSRRYPDEFDALRKQWEPLLLAELSAKQHYVAPSRVQNRAYGRGLRDLSYAHEEEYRELFAMWIPKCEEELSGGAAAS